MEGIGHCELHQTVFWRSLPVENLGILWVVSDCVVEFITCRNCWNFVSCTELCFGGYYLWNALEFYGLY